MITQVLSAPSMVKPIRKRRDEVKVFYRVSPKVKASLFKSADTAMRSENQQAEFFLKIGYLHSLGVNIYGMTDGQIVQKFEEVGISPVDEDDETNT